MTQQLQDDIFKMYKLQQKYNTSGRCVLNTCYVYHKYKDLISSLKKITGLVFYYDVSKKSVNTIVHCFLIDTNDNTIFEPSYEVGIIEDTYYFSTFKNYIDFLKKNQLDTIIDTKPYLKELIKLQKCCDSDIFYIDDKNIKDITYLIEYSKLTEVCYIELLKYYKNNKGMNIEYKKVEKVEKVE